VTTYDAATLVCRLALTPRRPMQVLEDRGLCWRLTQQAHEGGRERDRLDEAIATLDAWFENGKDSDAGVDEICG